MVFKRRKITVVGAGFTGETVAFMLAQKELGDIVLIDIPALVKTAKGKALDMLQSGPVEGFNVNLTGTADYKEITDSDIVVVTAGISRKPNMSRDDLLATNTQIMKEVSEKIAQYAPNSYVIVLSNPVDAMTYVCYKTTGFPKNRIIGQSGVLDTARFNTFVAEELNVSIEDVKGLVLGGHGDQMVPLTRYSSVGGIPLDSIISPDKLASIVERTRKGGGEIVELLGKGSAYYAPAASVVEMVEAILKDKKRVLPAVAYLEGEYGYKDICFGVPAILGGSGIESVIGLLLTEAEKISLDQSADTVAALLRKL